MGDREWCKKNCPYEPDCYGWGYDVCNYVISLLKEQEERIGALTRAIEQTPKPTKLLDVFGDGYAKVVRCKDCKHWWKKNELCTHEKTMDGSVCCLEAKPDFYCGYGERR